VAIQAKYVHTNLIARDWRALAAFYERVFGCVPVPPERDLAGPWLEAATGVSGARVRGAHLRLPGCGDGGPTLEIFQYEPPGPEAAFTIHRPGFGHIAFLVEDVAAAREAVLQAGGADYGLLVSLPVAGAGVVTFVYVADPEGNVVELQAWARPADEAKAPVRLECGRCAVRSWREGDLESLVRHANSRAVWLQLRDRFPHPYTAEAGRAWLRYAAEAKPETQFAVEVDGEAAGGIGFLPQRDIERCSAEVGYWLGERVWGRGVATAALRAVTDYAFAAFGLTRLYALPFADNLASRRVLEKAGYQLEAVLRRSAIKDGQIKDQALYALTRTPESAA
jgi:RimJ/RimL family protein N-acetyltransferase/catechol 2,3-dioxygenase-like lactoylglutathione lyase family enzyme